MAYELDGEVRRIFEVYKLKDLPMPAPRAFALRLLEEAVELALICGASVKDTYASFQGALSNEQQKNPNRRFEDESLGTPSEIGGEIADVSLLAKATMAVAGVADDTIEILATAKVDRLCNAAFNGTLHFEADGRFYRRQKTGGSA
jgi:hypothetical protein